MKRAAREVLPRHGVVRPETPTERRESESLAEDLRSITLTGQPLPLRLRNFTQSSDGYLGALGGPLAYMLRLREIERLTSALESSLAERWATLAAGSDAEDFPALWRAEVAATSFAELNALIERHNRWYPVESRLPMDPKRGDYALVNGEDYRRATLDETWVLERFSADRAVAMQVPRPGAVESGSRR